MIVQEGTLAERVDNDMKWLEFIIISFSQTRLQVYIRDYECNTVIRDAWEDELA